MPAISLIAVLAVCCRTALGGEESWSWAKERKDSRIVGRFVSEEPSVQTVVVDPVLGSLQTQLSDPPPDSFSTQFSDPELARLSAQFSEGGTGDSEEVLRGYFPEEEGQTREVQQTEPLTLLEGEQGEFEEHQYDYQGLQEEPQYDYQDPPEEVQYDYQDQIAMPQSQTGQGVLAPPQHFVSHLAPPQHHVHHVPHQRAPPGQHRGPHRKQPSKGRSFLDSLIPSFLRPKKKSAGLTSGYGPPDYRPPPPAQTYHPPPRPAVRYRPPPPRTTRSPAPLSTDQPVEVILTAVQSSSPSSRSVDGEKPAFKLANKTSMNLDGPGYALTLLLVGQVVILAMAFMNGLGGNSTSRSLPQDYTFWHLEGENLEQEISGGFSSLLSKLKWE